MTIITGSNPAQMQLDFGPLWTRKNIREMIRREFGVKMSEVQVGRVLRDLGLTPQKPLWRSYKQNPELVREWKKTVYPKLRARAAAEGAEIFFGDEASVRTDHHSGTTWAAAGQTPVVRDSGKRHAVKMISAISPQGLLRFQVHEGSMNGEVSDDPPAVDGKDRWRMPDGTVGIQEPMWGTSRDRSCQAGGGMKAKALRASVSSATVGLSQDKLAS